MFLFVFLWNNCTLTPRSNRSLRWHWSGWRTPSLWTARSRWSWRRTSCWWLCYFRSHRSRNNLCPNQTLLDQCTALLSEPLDHNPSQPLSVIIKYWKDDEILEQPECIHHFFPCHWKQWGQLCQSRHLFHRSWNHDVSIKNNNSPTLKINCFKSFFPHNN